MSNPNSDTKAKKARLDPRPGGKKKKADGSFFLPIFQAESGQVPGGAPAEIGG
jgi:hypothetical protein